MSNSITNAVKWGNENRHNQTIDQKKINRLEGETEWNRLYQLFIDHGFSTDRALEMIQKIINDITSNGVC